jgi:hypothetical protein
MDSPMLEVTYDQKAERRARLKIDFVVIPLVGMFCEFQLLFGCGKGAKQRRCRLVVFSGTMVYFRIGTDSDVALVL